MKRPAQPFIVGRRTLLASAAAWLIAPPAAGRAARRDGSALFADVATYSGFGDHRTGTAADLATSDWIARRLSSAGFAVDRQAFETPLFEPADCWLQPSQGAALPTFPVWPPVVTPAAGLSAPLATRAFRGAIAVVRLPYATNASLLTSSYADPIAAAVAAGAAAVVGITEGPTGEIIALNAVPGRYDWPVPVALVAGKHAARLIALADQGAIATLRQTGLTRPSKALNIVASRRGRGKALVVSTPTSGWFTCAGERGAGVALFLALARRSARAIRSPLVFVATSGHEIEGKGSIHALKGLPHPDQVGGWLHLGANLAGAQVAIQDGDVRRSDLPFPQRGVRASEFLLPSIRRAFEGVVGYQSPQIVTQDTAVGDVAHYLGAGYHPIAGLVAAHPLHHTPLDVPDKVTTPALLAELEVPLMQLLSNMDRLANPRS
ncbi:MAG TPA: hypothetical protein VEZ70_07265 [Allosphingosinicella sp.]|nr:hypothetical protein [Allosphingosinicella sp.]